MKKIVGLAISLCLIFGLTVQAFAQTTVLGTQYMPSIEQILEDSPNYFTNEHQDKVNDLLSKYQSLAKARGGTSRTLNVANQWQRDGYSCGLASAAQIVSYLNGYTVTQNSLMSGPTPTDGLQLLTVKGLINNNVSSAGYTEIGVWNSVYDNFSTTVAGSILRNRPVVALVKSTSLGPHFAPSLGHYVVIIGYQGGNSGNISVNNVIYNDPYNNNNYYGTFNTTSANMRNAIVAHSSWILAG